MYQIIRSKKNNRWEVMDTMDFFVSPEETFHNYKFETEEDAIGVYISKVLEKIEGFDRAYIMELSS